MTKPEFEALIANQANGGAPFILAVYQAMEQTIAAEESGCKFACHKGCSLCCRQLITATTIEMEAIAAFIRRLKKNQKQKMLRKAFKRAEGFNRWREQFSPQDSRLFDPLWLHRQWLGKSCPFLDSGGACGIYPVRPMDCRIHHSLTICRTVEHPDIRRMPYDCERWANNLVLEEEKKHAGKMAVVPLSHWLLVYRKKLAF